MPRTPDDLIRIELERYGADLWQARVVGKPVLALVPYTGDSPAGALEQLGQAIDRLEVARVRVDRPPPDLGDDAAGEDLARVLEVLEDAAPHALSTEAIAQRTGWPIGTAVLRAQRALGHAELDGAVDRVDLRDAFWRVKPS